MKPPITTASSLYVTAAAWWSATGRPGPVDQRVVRGSYTFVVVLDALTPTPPTTISLPSAAVAAAYWRRNCGPATGCQARSAGSFVATGAAATEGEPPPPSSSPPPASRTAATMATTTTRPAPASSRRDVERLGAAPDPLGPPP